MNDTMPPEGDVFDPIAYARWRGTQDAKSGPGFTPPYNVGDPRRRAWVDGYNSTPFGVPGMSGKPGVSEDEMVERNKATTEEVEVIIKKGMRATVADWEEVPMPLHPLAQVPRITRDEIALALYPQFIEAVLTGKISHHDAPSPAALAASEAVLAADILLAELNKK